MKTMVRMEKNTLRKEGRGEKRNKSSVISSRDVITSLFFSPHSQKRRYMESQQQKVQMHIFSLLHNSLWSLWKTNSIHLIVSFSIKSLIMMITQLTE